VVVYGLCVFERNSNVVNDFSPVDPWSHEFIVNLVRRFGPELAELLAERTRRRLDPDGEQAAVLRMPVLPETNDPSWRCAPIPRDLLDRRVEITGPGVDPKMVITALNSGANGYMVDGEDSMSPTWENALATQRNVYSAVRRTLRVAAANKTHEVNRDAAVLHYRPRGLHLFEVGFEVDGRPVPAPLVDAGLFLYWNARVLIDRGTGPYLYIPKLETEAEAAWWNRVMGWCEEHLELPPGSIRCTVLVETLPCLLRLEPVVWTLRARLTGLNVGRWDYIFSMIKTLRGEPEYVLPDRSRLVMESEALSEYARWVVRVAHNRGISAIGGMAAAVPNRRDPAASADALLAVVRDKTREAQLGHDGTWVAHPDLVDVARTAFSKVMRDRTDQRDVVPSGECLDRAVIVRPPAGCVTMDGVREAARSSLVYIDAWLGGNGCVAMAGKMEDAATAEISRALLWQWITRGVKLDDGTVVTRELVDAVVRGEAATLAVAGTEPRPRAVDLVLKSIMSIDIPEFITSLGYSSLIRPDRS
jgi:malate synthase